MIAYIIRRCLYAIPILFGVNILVFSIFFFVNSPDDVARHELGRRATPDRIDEYKREHNLDLPYLYNSGWQRVASLSLQKMENTLSVPLVGSGQYRFYVQVPQGEKLELDRTLKVRYEGTGLKLPAEFKAGELQLSRQAPARYYPFSIETTEPAELTLEFAGEAPSVMHSVALEIKTGLTLLESLTRTIFFQKSVKMLWFDYGKTKSGKTIREEILKRILPSLSVTVPVFILATIVSIVCSMLVALFRATYVDYWAMFLCVVAMSISIVFYIIGGQMLLGKTLNLWPISGFAYGWDSIKFVTLPIVISIVGGLGSSIRYERTIFLEEINKDYVRTARAKGLSERTVLFIHALKNAMLPILTSLVVSIPFLFTGSLLIESFFAIPGMGSFMLDAISSQDFGVVQALVCLGSFLTVLGLIMTDISYTLVDPRVRLE